MERAAANDRDDAGAQARRWIARLASRSMSAGDLAGLNDWLDAAPEHRLAFQRERRTWQDLASLEEAFAPATHGIDHAGGSTRRRLKPVATGLAIAACLALVSAMPAVRIWFEADYASPGTQARSIALADGSRAVLDADTALSVQFDHEERSVVLLKGRAWFDVRHGDARPFRVRAGAGVIEDLGTAFAVELDGPDVDVGVTQGSVRVTGGTGRPVLLTAGGRGRYGSGAAQRLAAIDPAVIARWREGELLLRAVSVKAAIAHVSRYRAAPVFVWGDLPAAARISGSFRTDRPDDALETLIVMRGLQQMRLPGGIVIVRAPTE
jgi:transmembrane sensor